MPGLRFATLWLVLAPLLVWAAANPYVTLTVVTDLGHARNVVIAQTARALIAVEGEYGTLSEMAVGLKLGRPVIALGSWPGLEGVHYVDTATAAVNLALRLALD